MGGCCSTPEEEGEGRNAPVAVEVMPQQAQRSKGASGHAHAADQQQQHREDGEPPEANAKSSVLGHCEAIRSHYIFDKVLGRGQFGVTRLVVHRVTGERAACKSISKRKLVNPEDVEDVRREIKVSGVLGAHGSRAFCRGRGWVWLCGTHCPPAQGRAGQSQMPTRPQRTQLHANLPSPLPR